MDAFDSGLVVTNLSRVPMLSSAQLSLGATFAGDLVFAVGQVTSDVVTSSIGAVIVVVSTLANIYLTFKRKQTELDIETKAKYREVMRDQKEKDLRLSGRIRETAELQSAISALQAENLKLRQQLKGIDSGQNSDRHP